MALLLPPALAAMIAGLVTVGQSAARAAIPEPPTGFTTVWSDDFTGPSETGVDTTDWLYDIGHNYPGGAANWGTGEIEEMTSSTANVTLDGSGHLAIIPVRDEAGNWTSGRIETQRTDFAAPAGGVLRVEASLQQPNVTSSDGAGYWPAFWMLGADARPVGATNWPKIGEIDLMENVNGRESVWSTLHCGVVAGGPCNETTGLSSGEKSCPGCRTGFHTYTMEYDRSVSPEQIRWYLDGALFHTLYSTAVDATTWTNALHHGFFIIFNVAIGGAFPAAFGAALPTSDTVSGQGMLIDYVSVATKGGSGPPLPPSPTPTPPDPVPSPTPPDPTATPTPPDPTATHPAGTRSAYTRLQAESFDSQSGTTIEPTSDIGGGSNIGRIADGDWLAYRGIDFGTAPAHQFLARVASGAGWGVSGLVEVRLDSRGNPPAGTFAIANTGGWQSWRTVPGNLSAVTGVHDVYLTFTSGQPADFVNVNWFTFAR